jgi:hypothetical protein
VRVVGSPNNEVILRHCVELGIPVDRIEGLRNILRAAFYHVGLPGTPPWDVHIAWDHAIRLVTGRIACQGEYGRPLAMGRVLSQGAMDSRADILRNPAFKSPPARFAAWRGGVTVEHQELVVVVEAWIHESKPDADRLLEHLLTYPSVIVTREEDTRLTEEGFRTRGTALERYERAKIVVSRGVVATGEFFRKGVPAKLGHRKYLKTPTPEGAEL